MWKFITIIKETKVMWKRMIEADLKVRTSIMSFFWGDIQAETWIISRSPIMWIAKKYVQGHRNQMCRGLEVENLVYMREESAWGQLGFLWALKALCFHLSRCVFHSVLSLFFPGGHLLQDWSTKIRSWVFFLCKFISSTKNLSTL